MVRACGLAGLVGIALSGCGGATAPGGSSTAATDTAAAAAPQGSGSEPDVAPVQGPTRQVPVPPDGKAYFGVQVEWPNDSPTAIATRLGRAPAVYGRFVSLPMSDEDVSQLDEFVAQVASVHGKLFLTLEPANGLEAVTPAVARGLAGHIAQWGTKGVDVFVRFGQEMNGSWYVWGQKPQAYISAFRIVADAVHTYSRSGVMVWSPNYGGGYPFPGQQYLAQPGTPAFAALDTNHDGRITEADDPYAPYYPGDQYVDWVGITLYHFGDAWPWGKNIVAEPHKFVDQLTGHYHGANGDDRSVPDFYATYAVGHHKPMALSETSALYNQSQAGLGAANLRIKQDWIGQALNPAFATQFPLLKMENWFEFVKPENGISGVIDWRATADPQVVAALRAALGSRFLLAG